MVDISNKPATKRIASAEGRIKVGAEVMSKIESKMIEKGDVLSVARVAGIMGAKQVDKLIPLCHQVSLTHIRIDIEPFEDSLIVRSVVESVDKTGVEMESLLAVTITLLTLYDMCKSVNKSMIISDVKLLHKKKQSIVHPEV